MTEIHDRTRHPEWYGHAPLSHPVIAQNTFECHRCGNLVVELSAHDEHHEQIDALLDIAKGNLTSSAPDNPGSITRITEPAIDVPARTGRPRASSSRGSSAGPQSAS